MTIHNPNKLYFRVWCRDQGRTLEMDTFDTSAAAKSYIKQIERDFDDHPHAFDLVCPSFSITTVTQQQIDVEYDDMVAYREENMAYAYHEL